MEQLRKYYVLAVAALNFVICAIAFFIWTRIVVMANNDDIGFFAIASIVVLIILCYVYSAVAAKMGIFSKEKKDPLGISAVLFSAILDVVLTIVLFNSILEASQRTKDYYVPKIFSNYTVYNVDTEKIKDKVYDLKQEYRKEYEEFFK